MKRKPSPQRVRWPVEGEGKCAVQTSRPVSHWCSRKLAPRHRRLRLVGIGPHRQLRVARLQRRVDQVAGQHADGLALAELDRIVVRRMAGRRDQPDMVVQRDVGPHHLRLAGGDDRQHAVLEDLVRRLGVLGLPVGVFLLAEDVFGLGEGRHPAAILQPGVPAHVVHMHVGAHDVVDVVHRGAGRRQVPLPGVGRLHVPEGPGRPRLVVADAGIDQDGVVRRADQVGLDAEPQLARRRVDRRRARARRGSPPAPPCVSVGKNSSGSKSGVSSSITRWISRSPSRNFVLILRLLRGRDPRLPAQCSLPADARQREAPPARAGPEFAGRRRGSDARRGLL